MTAIEADLEPPIDPAADAAAEKARVVEKRRRRWGCLLYAGLAILVPVLILFSAYLWFHLADRRLAEEALARASAAGDPLTTEEMQALFYPPSPAIDEATKHWQRAIEFKQEADRKTVRPQVPYVGSVTDPEVDENGFYAESALKLIDEYLEGPGEDAIQGAHEARRAGAVARFATDVPTDEPKLDDTGDPQRLREVRTLLALDMERAAARGDYDRAVEDVLSMIAVAEAFADDPTPYGMDLHVAMYGVSYTEARDLIDRVDLSDEQLRRLDSAFAKPDFHRGLVRMLQADQYRVVRAYETDEPADDEEYEVIRRFPLRGADEALAIELFQDSLDESKIDLAGAKTAQTRLLARHAEFDRMSKVEHFRYAMAILSSWETERYFTCALKADTEQKLMRAGVACERYRQTHGAWPESLEALVPEYLAEVPIDLFDGGPLRYKVEGDRLSLYSDEQDERYPTSNFDDGPLTFVVEKPSQQR